VPLPTEFTSGQKGGDAYYGDRIDETEVVAHTTQRALAGDILSPNDVEIGQQGQRPVWKADGRDKPYRSCDEGSGVALRALIVMGSSYSIKA